MQLERMLKDNEAQELRAWLQLRPAEFLRTVVRRMLAESKASAARELPVDAPDARKDWRWTLSRIETLEDFLTTLETAQ